MFISKKLKFRIISIIFAAFLLGINYAAGAVSLDKIAAIVNNDVISNGELQQHINILLTKMDVDRSTLPPRHILEQQILQKLINDKLQMQRAQQVGLEEVDSITVDKAIQEIAAQEGMTLAQYNSYLSNKKINFADLRNLIKTELIISRLHQRELAQEIKITDVDIDGYLNSPVGQDQSGAKYRLGHILLLVPETPTPELLQTLQHQAAELVTQLRGKADFKTMAMEKSAGQQALSGGDLGLRSIGEIPTLFSSYVPSMEVGQIVGPIRSSNGLHIIKLMEKQVGAGQTTQEIKLRQILIKPVTQALEQTAQETLQDLRLKILQGEKFSKVTSGKNLDNNIILIKEDLGWIKENDVFPEFYSNVQKLAINEISQPFKTELGWHIVQMLARRSPNNSHEAARNRARNILFAQKSGEMQELWLKRLRDEAQIEILLTSKNK